MSSDANIDLMMKCDAVVETSGPERDEKEAEKKTEFFPVVHGRRNRVVRFRSASREDIVKTVGKFRSRMEKRSSEPKSFCGLPLRDRSRKKIPRLLYRVDKADVRLSLSSFLTYTCTYLITHIHT